MMFDLPNPRRPVQASLPRYRPLGLLLLLVGALALALEVGAPRSTDDGAEPALRPAFAVAGGHRP